MTATPDITTFPAHTAAATPPPARYPMLGYLRAGEAAQHLGIDRSTLWRWICTGVVPPAAVLRIGRHARVAGWWLVAQSQPAIYAGAQL
jgi:predicted DNA-binding transcriptional regulator AlpA